MAHRGLTHTRLPAIVCGPPSAPPFCKGVWGLVRQVGRVLPLEASHRRAAPPQPPALLLDVAQGEVPTGANARLDCRAGPFSASGQRRRGFFSRQPQSARGSHPLEVHHAVRDVGRKAPSGGPRVSVSGRPCGVVRTKPGGVQFFQPKGEATERGAGRHQENRLTVVNASSRLPQCRHRRAVPEVGIQ